MALGNILKEAREACGLSTTEVAEHTNMMVQIVEELENEDFHRIAAPIYGRGFLKLYAELLNIDVQPLIDEFMDLYTGKTVPTVQRKDSIPADIKKPVPMVAEDDENNKSVAPGRVEIVPRQAVRNIDGGVKPIPLHENQPVRAALNEVVENTVPDSSIFSSHADTFSMESAAGSEQDVQSAQTMFDESESSEEKLPPAPGDDLFAADEPNLFNSTPLQERIAEAKRMMEEKEEEKMEKKQKKASLHLGSNQSVPVFQIGGRMDKTYEPRFRKIKRSSKFDDFAGTLLRAIGEFFREHKIKVPFNFSTGGNRTVFVYSSLGFIIILILVSGIFTVLKFTDSSSQKGESESSSVTMSKNTEHRNPSAVSDFMQKVPSPPDMFFD